MPKPQEYTDTFILTKKLFLVGLLGLQNISNPVERPCILVTYFDDSQPMMSWANTYDRTVCLVFTEHPYITYKSGGGPENCIFCSFSVLNLWFFRGESPTNEKGRKDGSYKHQEKLTFYYTMQPLSTTNRFWDNKKICNEEVSHFFLVFWKFNNMKKRLLCFFDMIKLEKKNPLRLN